MKTFNQMSGKENVGFNLNQMEIIFGILTMRFVLKKKRENK